MLDHSGKRRARLAQRSWRWLRVASERQLETKAAAHSDRGTPLKRMLINYPHTSNLGAELIRKHEIMQYDMATYEGGLLSSTSGSAVSCAVYSSC